MEIRERRGPASQEDRNTEGTNQAATPKERSLDELGKGLVSEFHTRSGESHAEARKLLTGMAVGSLGVLYATLTGADAPTLVGYSRYLAIATIVSMALAAGFGLAAWRADAAWAYGAAENYRKNPGQIKPDGGRWHDVKKWCDRSQVALFGVGLFLAALLTLELL